MRNAEIGIDDVLIGFHLVRRAVRDLFAVIQHHHPVCFCVVAVLVAVVSVGEVLAERLGPGMGFVRP